MMRKIPLLIKLIIMRIKRKRMDIEEYKKVKQIYIEKTK